MACYECETFLSHLKVAIEWHAEVMGNLERMATSGGISESDFTKLKKELLTAYRDCLQAQETLNAHRESHADRPIPTQP